MLYYVGNRCLCVFVLMCRGAGEGREAVVVLGRTILQEGVDETERAVGRRYGCNEGGVDEVLSDG